MKFCYRLIFVILLLPLILLAPEQEDQVKKSGELVVAKTKPVTKFEELPADLLDKIVEFLGFDLALRQLGGACKKFRCWTMA